MERVCASPKIKKGPNKYSIKLMDLNTTRKS